MVLHVVLYCSRMVRRRVICISGKDKFRERLFTRPTPADIRFSELRSFLEAYGFTAKSGNDDAHYSFHMIQNDRFYSVQVAKPHNSGAGVKRSYLKNIIQTIEIIEQDA